MTIHRPSVAPLLIARTLTKISSVAVAWNSPVTRTHTATALILTLDTRVAVFLPEKSRSRVGVSRLLSGRNPIDIPYGHRTTKRETAQGASRPDRCPREP